MTTTALLKKKPQLKGLGYCECELCQLKQQDVLASYIWPVIHLVAPVYATLLICTNGVLFLLSS